MIDAIEKINNIYTSNKTNTFIIDNKTKEEYTYLEFFSLSSQFANLLISIGLKKGDSLSVFMDNSIETAIVYFAALMEGIIVVPINPSTIKNDIIFLKNDSNSEYIVCQERNLNKINNIFNDKIICFDLLNTRINNISKTLNKNLEFLNDKPFSNLLETDIMMIIYTSGTTSKPKGVVHKISDLVNNGLYFNKLQSLSNNSRFLNLLPMTYLGGYYNLLFIPYLASGSTVITDAYNSMTVLNFWDQIINNNVNVLWLTPTIMSIMLELDRNQDGIEYCNNNDISLFVGTAPLSQQLKNDFESKYSLKVIENYGLSETLFISTNTKNDCNNKDLGLPLDTVKVLVRDLQTNKILEPGKEGEIFVKTPYLLDSYLNIDMQLVDDSGFFATGDVGYINNRGAIEITGRKKDLIIRGGINISPASIEEITYQHEKVLECAVVGIPHSIMGEEVVVIIRVSETNSFENISKELKVLYKSSLSKIQQPTKIYEILSFPHTYSGKIQKNKLKSWLIDKKDLKDIQKTMHTSKDVSESFFKPSNTVSNIIEATSIRYNTMVYELKKDKKDVIILSYGESYFDIPLFDFNELPYPSLYHYGNSRGLEDLRVVLSKYYLNKYEIKFSPDEEIIITTGSKIAIYMSLLAVVDPGDEVIIQDPAWVSYTEQIKLCHAHPIQIPYDESVFNFEKYITNKTKMIIINNPNNPSGKVYTLEELTFLYKLAQKYNLFLLSDEAYSDFLLENEQFISFGNLDKDMKHTIICNSISKNCGISGWRLGYIVSNKKIINEILKINQHLITCPPTILEFYMAKYFNKIVEIVKPQIEDLLIKRAKVIEYMDSISLSYLEGSATFYIFASIDGTKLSSEEFCKKLMDEKSIAVVPGIGYGPSCDKYIRISIGVESNERIFKAIDEIKKLIIRTEDN